MAILHTMKSTPLAWLEKENKRMECKGLDGCVLTRGYQARQSYIVLYKSRWGLCVNKVTILPFASQ